MLFLNPLLLISKGLVLWNKLEGRDFLTRSLVRKKFREWISYLVFTVGKAAGALRGVLEQSVH